MRRGVRLAAGIALVLSGAIAQAQIVNSGSAVGTSLTVSTLNTGSVLQVSGAVSADGRYVTMDVNPQFSTLDGLDMFVLPDTVGTGGGAGGTGLSPAIGVRPVPFRPAQIGNTVFVDHDKTLLAARAKTLDLKQTSLKLAMRKLADASGVNIVLGIRGLEEAGINVNELHDFSSTGGTVKEALLDIIKTGAPAINLVITAEDKVISIATQTQADNAVVTKTYYLADLLANVPRFVSGTLGGKRVDLSRSTDFSQPPEYPSSGQLPATPAPKPAAPTGTITDLITGTVRPEIWKVNGGKVGEIAVVGDRVTIKAPQSVHALLEGPKRYNPNRVPMYVGYGQ